MSEQLEALEHMFPDCVVEASLPTISIFINNDLSHYESSIIFKLISNYSTEGEMLKDPHISFGEIQSTVLSLEDCALLTKELMDVIEADPTDLIAATVFAREQLLTKLEAAITERSNAKIVAVSEHSESRTTHDSKTDVDEQWIKRLCILKSNVIRSKKSVFFAHTAYVLSVEDVKQFHAFLCDTQGIDNATHNIVAYRLCQTGDPSCLHEDFDDDGEHAAGGRLLLLMQKMKLYNRVAIVTRYFGGVQLGPARFKYINDCAQEVMLKAKQVDPNFCSGL